MLKHFLTYLFVCYTPHFIISAENNSESLRKEITDVRRLLADSTFEKEKYHNTNKDLRDHVKKIEGEKREQSRQLEESFQKITSKLTHFLTKLKFDVVDNHFDQLGNQLQVKKKIR